MTKAELINAVAHNKSMSQPVSKKQASSVVDQVFKEIKTALARGEAVTIPGFGSFAPVKLPSRKPKGNRSSIKAVTTVSFRPAQTLKDFLGGKKKK